MSKLNLSSIRRRCGILLAASAASLCVGCATTGGDSRDPFEGFNRSMYGFNQSVDEAILKPVSKAYKEGLPEIVQTGVRNFFSNIADIFISVNNLLQGKVIDAANDGLRFAVNTTIGGFGLLIGLLKWAWKSTTRISAKLSGAGASATGRTLSGLFSAPARPGIP